MEDNILDQLFLQRLPINAKRVLVSTSDSVNIEKLADITDKIIEVAIPPTSSISAVTSQFACDVSEPATSDMQWRKTQMDQVTAQIQALTCHLKEECS